jgi:hypothetical protein
VSGPLPCGTGDTHAGSHKWEAVRVAIDSTARTVRLCVILLTMSVATAAPFLIVALAHRWLG